MRKIFSLCALLVVCGCQQKQDVAVPTTKELMANPQLLSEWQAKCNTSDYSHLPADQKDNLCFTTREAARSLAVTKVGNEEADFFDQNTRRKK
ncbi:hypothetical protein GCM10008023_39320 [Sphingomonas glacialis]|uniref:Lipoprotein n=1 Tax=Sphingomonas glacialis TaxID=658225 RepID=A0ABQ3LVC5_9SPHN|nr:hypothetical protein [Sphingomonas glacialis]GHH25678.1 hypothetical protein GCM10008023_39320 [Sphingomonas glacialis]